VVVEDISCCSCLSCLPDWGVRRHCCIDPCKRLVVNRGLNIPMSVPDMLLSDPRKGGAQARMAFGDSGIIDATAILALLTRGCRELAESRPKSSRGTERDVPGAAQVLQDHQYDHRPR